MAEANQLQKPSLWWPVKPGREPRQRSGEGGPDYYHEEKTLELKLTSVKKNPLFNRQEIEFMVEQNKTPSRSNVRIGVAVAMKVDLNNVYVREIETKSGTHVTVGSAHVYADPEQALKIEPKYIIERNQKAKAEPEPEPEAEPEPEPEVEEAPEEEPEAETEAEPETEEEAEE